AEREPDGDGLHEARLRTERSRPPSARLSRYSSSQSRRTSRWRPTLALRIVPAFNIRAVVSGALRRILATSSASSHSNSAIRLPPEERGERRHDSYGCL